jgi:hypothetical protein
MATRSKEKIQTQQPTYLSIQSFHQRLSSRRSIYPQQQQLLQGKTFTQTSTAQIGIDRLLTNA